MTTFKYIMVTANAIKNGEKKLVHIPLIFGHFFSHRDISVSARQLARCGQFRLQDIEVYSAGFVDIGGKEIVCHGESETLGMKPKSNDAELIRDFRMDWSLS